MPPWRGRTSNLPPGSWVALGQEGSPRLGEYLRISSKEQGGGGPGTGRRGPWDRQGKGLVLQTRWAGLDWSRLPERQPEEGTPGWRVGEDTLLLVSVSSGSLSPGKTIPWCQRHSSGGQESRKPAQERTAATPNPCQHFGRGDTGMAGSWHTDTLFIPAPGTTRHSYSSLGTCCTQP